MQAWVNHFSTIISGKNNRAAIYSILALKLYAKNGYRRTDYQ